MVRRAFAAYLAVFLLLQISDDVLRLSVFWGNGSSYVPWHRAGPTCASAQFASYSAFTPEDGKCGDLGPWTEGMCYTDDQGLENEHCKPCLVGVRWDKLREQLGSSYVRGNRTTVPVVKYGTWLSSTLMGNVFRILLKEMLGYNDVRTVTTGTSYYIEEAASEECQATSFESWFEPEEARVQFIVETPQKHKAMGAPVGIRGIEGLYVPNYMPPSARHFKSIGQHIGDPANATDQHSMMRPDGTVGPQNLTEYFPDGDPWGCSDADWTVSKCNSGRWYPPRCGSTFPSPTCSEMLIADQEWSGGWYEGATNNLGLNLSAVYTSYAGQVHLTERLYGEKKGFIFYWWEPDPLVIRFPSSQVMLPRYTAECNKGYDTDPLLSATSCQLQKLQLDKFINANLKATDPDLFHLWEAFWLDNNEVLNLMSYHTLAGGAHDDMQDTACSWLKSREDDVKWTDWLKIHDRCPQPNLEWDNSTSVCIKVAPDAAEDKLGVPVWLIVLLVMSFIALQLFLMVLYLIARKRQRKGDLETTAVFAPPKEGEQVTLVITDIQGSTSLWDAYPKEMASGIDLHHKILRAALKECQGYEVATEGDSFKCAFRTPEDAICWSVLVQMDLMAAPWDEKLEDGGARAFFQPHKWADMSKFLSAMGYRLWDKALTEGEALVITDQAGKPRKLPFSAKAASQTGYTQAALAKYPASGVVHNSCKMAVPAFRGLRVRIGMHTGMADMVTVHEKTKRAVYGGDLAVITKAISEVPSGGQIIASGETIAAIGSMHGLQQRVYQLIKGWTSIMDVHDKRAALAIVHMGSHIVDGMPWCYEDAASTVAASSVADMAGSDAFPVSVPQHPRMLQKKRLTDPIGHQAEDRCGNLPDHLRSERRKSLPSGSLPHSCRCVRRDKSDVFRAVQAVRSRASAASFSDGPEAADPADPLGLVDYEDKLMIAVELVALVPLALKARQRCFPNLNTMEMLAPGFYDAPSPARVTILFIFIERWQHLLNWSERNPMRQMVLADTKKLYNLHVRAALHAHGGYEVEGEDGCFVCAFGTPEEAVEFSVRLQNGLSQAWWNPELLRSKHCCRINNQEGDVVLAGPRSKIGMCTSDAEHAQPSPRTGKMEYFGPIMNHAARVASTAYGGQVLLHEATNEALDLDLLASDIVLTACGKHRLKGMKQSIKITQASVPGCKQNFPKLGTSGDEDLQPMLEYLSTKGQRRRRAKQRLTIGSPSSKTPKSTASNKSVSELDMDQVVGRLHSTMTIETESRSVEHKSGPNFGSDLYFPSSTSLAYPLDDGVDTLECRDDSQHDRTVELPAALRLMLADGTDNMV